MSERRRMLLAIVNQFKWLPYSYTYLYHSLVPQTISGKNVRNKAKFTKIYGNSEVANQLVNKSTLNASASNISVDTNTGKVELDLSTFIRYANTFTLSNNNEYIIDLVQGHKYLLRGFKATSTPASDNSWWIQVRNNSAGVSGRLYNENEIFTANNGGLSAIFIYVLNNYTANDKIVGYPQLIDLTQMFPFDTPTTLTDNRVKNILAQGYIPYNLGEIKDTEIGNFSSDDSNNQPFGTLQLPALYKSSGIGTSKDSWEITSTSHIFTRSNFVVELSSLAFSMYGTAPNYLFYADVSGGRSSLGASVPSNILCDKYNVNTLTQGGTATAQGADKTATWDANHSQILIKDTTYATASDFQNNVSGKLKYQLATPQVITIPRKHLAVKKLKNLAWVRYTSGLNGTYYAILDSNGLESDNSYIANYLNKGVGQETSLPDMNYCLRLSTGLIFLRNVRATDEYELRASFKDSDVIFYDTLNEVADIADTFCIEAGGSVNGNLFSWVRNQVVANGDFSNGTTGWNGYGGSLSATNNIGTLTITSSAGSNRIQQDINPSTNHKYLISFDVKSSRASVGFAQFGVSIFTLEFNINTTWSNYSVVYAPTSTTDPFRLYINRNNQYLQNGDTVDFRNIRIIDLTLAFGAGNEPTDINDYRIQYILEHGYIPTDVNGTYTNECCEVLPDVDFSMKCK